MRENQKKQLMNEFELREIGKKAYEEMDEQTKSLVSKVMFSTIDMINSFNPDSPFFFYEAVAWRLFREEMLGHLKNNDDWHVEDKCWVTEK